MKTIENVLKYQKHVTSSRTEVRILTDKLLSQFRMDALKDIHKSSSTQMMVEDVDRKMNLT